MLESREQCFTDPIGPYNLRVAAAGCQTKLNGAPLMSRGAPFFVAIWLPSMVPHGSR